MMVSLKRYFFDVENIMELLMLVVTAVILYGKILNQKIRTFQRIILTSFDCSDTF